MTAAVAGRREGCAKLSCSWQATPELPPGGGLNGGYQAIPMGYPLVIADIAIENGDL